MADKTPNACIHTYIEMSEIRKKLRGLPKEAGNISYEYTFVNIHFIQLTIFLRALLTHDYQKSARIEPVQCKIYAHIFIFDEFIFIGTMSMFICAVAQ